MDLLKYMLAKVTLPTFITTKFKTNQARSVFLVSVSPSIQNPNLITEPCLDSRQRDVFSESRRLRPPRSPPFAVAGEELLGLRRRGHPELQVQEPEAARGGPDALLLPGRSVLRAARVRRRLRPGARGQQPPVPGVPEARSGTALEPAVGERQHREARAGGRASRAVSVPQAQCAAHG